MPEGCDLNAWLAVATVDFYNITNARGLGRQLLCSILIFTH